MVLIVNNVQWKNREQGDWGYKRVQWLTMASRLGKWKVRLSGGKLIGRQWRGCELKDQIYWGTNSWKVCRIRVVGRVANWFEGIKGGVKIIGNEKVTALWGHGSVLIILMVKSGLAACFVNKVLLEHSHVYLFAYCWWLLSSCNSRGR